MKTKILTFMTALAVVLYSCSSDSNDDNNNDDNYFIKAKVDGQTINVDYYAQAILYGTGNERTLKLYAGNSLSNIYPFFSFDIDNISQVSAGNYSRATNITLFQFYNSNQEGYGDYDVNNTNDFSLQITEVTNTYVKGTFQGVLWEEENLNETINVTEGEFYLPRYYNEYGNTTPNN